MSGLPKKLKKPTLAGTLRPEDVAVKPKPSLNAAGKRPITKSAIAQPSSSLVKKPRLDASQPELFSTVHTAVSSAGQSPPPLPSVEYDDLKAFSSKGKCDEVEDSAFVETLRVAVRDSKYNKACRLIVASLLKVVSRAQESGRVSFDAEIMSNIVRVVAENAEKLTNIYVPKCVFWVLSLSKGWNLEKQTLLTAIVTRLAESQQHLPPFYALAFLWDSLGDRVWADKPHCSRLVSLILKRFNTRFPEHDLYSHTNGELSPPTWIPETDVEDKFPPNTEGLTELEREKERRRRRKEREKDDKKEGDEKEEDDDLPPLRINVVEDVLVYLRRWWDLKSDVPPRALLRTLAVFCGLSEVRVAVARRLDGWLQNAKVQRQALDLLLQLGVNFGSASDCVSDQEALGHLLRMKSLKSKQVQAVFSAFLASLAVVDENARLALRSIIVNELGPQLSRSPHNMTILQSLFSIDNRKVTKLLAEELCSIVFERPAMMKAACMMVRELVRSHLRTDFYFSRFLSAYLSHASSQMLSGEHFDENVTSTAAAVCNLIVWIGITPQIRETFAVRRQGDTYNTQMYTRFCAELNEYFESALKWLRQSRHFFSELKEYVLTLYKLLFLDKGVFCMGIDGGPTEPEWALCQRIISEVHPTQQLIKYIVVDNFCDPTDLIHILHLITERILKYMALNIVDQNMSVVENCDLSLIGIVFELSEFKTKSSALTREEASALSVRQLYWQAFGLAFIWSCCGRSPLLLKNAHATYPTLRLLMQMALSDDFSPSPIVLDELTTKEATLLEEEKERALNVERIISGRPDLSVDESHLATICCLTDPCGPARLPPAELLSSLSQICLEHNLGARLCESRDPDLLAELVKKCGAAKAISSISALLSSDPSAVDSLPVESLCEFLLHKLQHPDNAREDTDKVQMIYARLRACVCDVVDGDTTGSTSSVFATTLFLLERLSSTNPGERRAVTQILSTVYAQHVDAMETEDSGTTTSCLQAMANNSRFPEMRIRVCELLARACPVESDSGRLKSYINFIKEQLIPEDDLHETARSLSLLVSKAPDSLHSSLIEFFDKYVRAVSVKTEVMDEHASGDLCTVFGGELGKIVMSRSSISAQLELLCSTSVAVGGDPRKRLVDLWFPKTGVVPSASHHGQAIDVLPEALRSKMLCTDDENIVNVALAGVTSSRAVRLLRRFGLTVHCAGKLLSLLDDLNIDEVSLSDVVSVRPFVIAYKGRGANGGDKFMREVNARTEAVMKEEPDEVPVSEPPPRPASSPPVAQTPPLDAKLLVQKIKMTMAEDGDFAIGSLEMRSVLADERTAAACLEHLEGNLKFFLDRANAFLQMLLMMNAAAEKFRPIRMKLCIWAGKVLKGAQPPSIVVGLLQKFAPTAGVAKKRRDAVGSKASTADGILDALSGSAPLTQAEQSRLLGRYMQLRPEVVDISENVDAQVLAVFAGHKKNTGWLAAQLPLVCSPETLRAVLDSILSSFEKRLNTAYVTALFSFCACEGKGVVCSGLRDSQLVVMTLYLVTELEKNVDAHESIMKIADALVSACGFEALRPIAESAMYLTRGDRAAGRRDSLLKLVDSIEQQFPCVQVDRVRCSATIKGVHWRLAEADRTATQLIATVFKTNTPDVVASAIRNLDKVLRHHPKVIERHLGVLSRLLAELVSISSRELRDSPKKAAVGFAVRSLIELVPKADKAYLEHVDSLMAVLIVYFERHLLGTRHGSELCDQLLCLCLQYLDHNLVRGKALVVENADNLSRMCDTRPDSFVTRSIRETISSSPS